MKKPSGRGKGNSNGSPDTIEEALSLLQYSSIGQDLWDKFNEEYFVWVRYSNDDKGYVHTYNLLFFKAAIIEVNPNATATTIAGTLAHEANHLLTPGDSLLEEYNSFLIGDTVRNDIIQAGYGTSADMMQKLSEYNVNTSNPDQTQLSADLTNWFLKYHQSYITKWKVPPLP